MDYEQLEQLKNFWEAYSPRTRQLVEGEYAYRTAIAQGNVDCALEVAGVLIAGFTCPHRQNFNQSRDLVHKIMRHHFPNDPTFNERKGDIERDIEIGRRHPYNRWDF